MYNPILEN